MSDVVLARPSVPAPVGIPAAALPPAGSSSEQKINYVQVLWKGKFWILLLLIVGAVIGFSKTVRQQPMFRASATVELLGTNEGVMGMSLIDPQSSAGANAANVQTQIYILTSRSMLSRVAERVNLEVTPVTPPSQGWVAKVRNRLGYVQQEPITAMKDAVQQAGNTLDVRPMGASRLLTISCTSSSPEVAAAFLNALSSEYIAQSQQVRSSVSSRTMQWLEGQIEETKSRLEQADSKLQAFIRKNGVDVAREQIAAPDPRVQQMQADLGAVQADRINKQTRVDLAKSGSVESVAEITDDGGVKAIREKLAEVRRERAQLLSVYTPENPKVRKMDAQVAELENMLNNERANLLKRLQNEYDVAARREKAITGAYSAQSRAVYGNLDKAGEYAMIKREADTARQTYNTLLQQLNQSNIVAALPATYVRVIDQANPPTQPYAPEPRREIASGALGGGVVAAGLLLLREFLRLRKLRNVFTAPGHSSDVLNLRELGVIPSRLEDRPKHRLLPQLRRRLGSENTLDRSYTSAWNGRPTVWSESFRFILTSLVYGKTAEDHRTLVITSAGPAEGKTTVAGNLAIVAAESGRRVLVIDADVRKPHLHDVFEVSVQHGLRDLLTSSEPLEFIDCGAYIKPTKFTGVSILTAGLGLVDESGELLFSSRIPLLIRRLREQYDLVLIDTAPALMFSDARRIGVSADGVVLVVRGSRTLRDSALTTLRSFADAHIPVIGTVLNDCGSDQMNSYYSYYQPQPAKA